MFCDENDAWNDIADIARLMTVSVWSYEVLGCSDSEDLVFLFLCHPSFRLQSTCRCLVWLLRFVDSLVELGYSILIRVLSQCPRVGGLLLV